MSGRDSRAELEFDVVATSALGEPARARIIALFRASYREANEAYLERSLSRLRFLATATSADGLAGFALGEMRIMEPANRPSYAHFASFGGFKSTEAWSA